jgi:hypothetical protein
MWNRLTPQSGVAKRWRHFWNKNGDSFWISPALLC